MEIFVLFLILIATAVLQAYIYKKYVFKKLDYACKFSTGEAFEGDSIYLVETMHNKKLLPVPWIKVNITSSRWLDFAETKSTIAQDARYVTSGFYLRSYQKTTRRWNLKCLKRGVYSIGNATIVSSDLLGFHSGSIPVAANTTLTVYPGTVNLENILASANYLQGDTIVKRWIVDDPFVISGIREYTSGDPLNRIHWQATAKAGQLMSKKNDYTTLFNLTIILNIQSREYEYNAVIDKELIELGIKISSTFLDRALKAGIPVKLATNGCTTDNKGRTVFTDEASGREHISSLMRILATLELVNYKSFDVYLSEIASLIRNNQVVLITSYMNDNLLDTIRKFKYEGNGVKIIMLSYIPPAEIPDDVETYFITGDDMKNAG